MADDADQGKVLNPAPVFKPWSSKFWMTLQELYRKLAPKGEPLLITPETLAAAEVDGAGGGWSIYSNNCSSASSASGEIMGWPWLLKAPRTMSFLTPKKPASMPSRKAN